MVLVRGMYEEVVDLGNHKSLVYVVFRGKGELWGWMMRFKKIEKEKKKLFILLFLPVQGLIF